MVAHPLQWLVRQLHRQALRDQTAALADGDLLRRFVRDQEEVAFETLVQRHGPMVHGLCRRVLHNPHDADDAFQATFLVLLRKAKSLLAPESLGNWLYGVAWRAAQQVRDRNARRAARETALPESVPAHAPNPAETRELADVLDEEISRLGTKYRTAIVLCDLEGGSRQEVASQLGIPEKTLSTRLATARQTLAKRLAKRGYTAPAGALATALGGSSASAAMPLGAKTALVQAAILLGKGQALTAVASPPVAFLTQGVLKTMLLTRVTMLGAGLTALVALATVGLGAGGFLREEPANPEVPNLKANLPGMLDLTRPQPDQGDAKPQTIDIRSIYTTSRGQQGFKERLSAAWVIDPNSREKKPASQYTYDLNEINSKNRTGASNIFLVRGDDLRQAINSTRHVFTTGADAETPRHPAIDHNGFAPLAKSDKFWLAVYLGNGYSTPPLWLFRSATIENQMIEFRFSRPKWDANATDSIQYFYWIPLPALKAGIYELRLFDVDEGRQTLTRWVRIP